MLHVFLNKVFIWTMYKKDSRKPFAWKVMSSVLSLFILHDFLLSSVALWSSFAFACSHSESLSTTINAIRFSRISIARHHNKGKGVGKTQISFQIIAFRKVTMDLKYYLDRSVPEQMYYEFPDALPSR